MRSGVLPIQKKLDLKVFSPDDAPYVPLVLRVGVNLLEERTGNWEYIYARNGFRPRANTILDAFLYNRISSKEIEKRMIDSDVCDLAFIVKGFLGSLDVTPMGTGTLVLTRLAGSYEIRNDRSAYKSEVDSLFDQVLQHLSPVALHTSCFMMIHLQHIWEYCVRPLNCRQMLGEIFGPLLLGSKPPVDPVDPLEVLLDVYDSNFWYKVSGCQIKMRGIFRYITPAEFRALKFSKFVFKDFLTTASIQPMREMVAEGAKHESSVEDETETDWS